VISRSAEITPRQKETGMSDAGLTNAPPVPISEHSRVLIAMHKAMRADSQRLIRAVDALPAGDTQQAAALAAPLPPSSASSTTTTGPRTT
jgi:hypothetical protein